MKFSRRSKFRANVWREACMEGRDTSEELGVMSDKSETMGEEQESKSEELGMENGE